MLKTKTMLIIGGTGFIGYHLARIALKKGWSVTSISKNKPKKLRKIKKVKYIVCDITNKNKLKKKINKNYNFVINLGGYVDHVNKQKTYNSHYLGSKNLSEIFLRKKLISFVQIGSGGEYGSARSPHNEKMKTFPKGFYFKAKAMATKYFLELHKKKKFPVTILRLYQAYGPKQDTNRLIPIVIKSCLKNKKFPCSTGIQYRDFLHIDDLINSILKCYDNKAAIGQIINIGSGKPEQIKNVIGLIKNKIKRGYPQFGKIKLRSDENIKVYPSLLKAKKILNWKPTIQFKRGLFKTIKSYEQ